jgi:hypothetical protein
VPNRANPTSTLTAVGMAMERVRNSRSGSTGSAAQRAVTSQPTVAVPVAAATSGVRPPMPLLRRTTPATVSESSTAPSTSNGRRARGAGRRSVRATTTSATRPSGG